MQMVMDAVVVTVIFFLAFYLKLILILPDPALDLRAYISLFLIELPFIMAAMALSGLYSLVCWNPQPWSRFLKVLRATLVVSIVFLAVSFYMKLFSYSRVLFTIFFMLLPFGLMIPRLIQHLIATYKPVSPRSEGGKIALVTDNDSHKIHRWLTHMFGRPVVVHNIGNGPGGPSWTPGLFRQGDTDSIVLDLSNRYEVIIEEVIRAADKEGVAVYLTPRFLPSGVYNVSWVNFGGVDLIVQRPTTLPLWGYFIKRSVDLVISIFMLFLVLPLFLVLILGIWLTSGRPVFYKQERVGYCGRRFTILKFRTMIRDAEEKTGPVWASDNDGRVTVLGSFLRRSNLDELPQLFNVIKGDMSLVGPRPERPEFVENFKGQIEHYSHKHWVPPGITGWAQVNGWRGDTDINCRIEHDIYYIQNWSVWLDIKILFLTPFVAYKNAM